MERVTIFSLGVVVGFLVAILTLYVAKWRRDIMFHIIIFILGTYFGCVVTLIFIVSKIDGFKNAVCDGNPKERVRRFGQIK